MRKKHIFLVCLFLSLVVYVGSYYVLSRRGFAQSRQWNMRGFYFFTPENSKEWRRRNYFCVTVYRPLIELDCLLGTGMPAGCEPLWGLSK